MVGTKHTKIVPRLQDFGFIGLCVLCAFVVKKGGLSGWNGVIHVPRTEQPAGSPRTTNTPPTYRNAQRSVRAIPSVPARTSAWLNSGSGNPCMRRAQGGNRSTPACSVSA
jgi:hypothetical protein